MIRDYKRWFSILPLIIGIAVVPLVVQARSIPVNLVEYVTWRGLETYTDFFARGKFEMLILAGIIASVMVLVHLRSHTPVPLKQFYILIGALVLLTLISTLAERYLGYIDMNFSSMTYKLELINQGQYENIGLFGYPERYEGLVTWMCYIILLMLAMKGIQQNDYQKLFVGLCISAAFIALIGLTQMLGYDIFRSSFGLWLMNLTNFEKLNLSGIQYAFGDREVYSTLFNPNYVGGYVTLVLPVIVSLIFVFRNLWQKILVSFVGVLLLINLIGSGSLTGMLGLMISLLVLCLMHRKALLKYVKWLGPALVVFVIGVSLFLILSNSPTAVQVRETVGSIVTDISGGNQMMAGEYEQITGIGATEQVIYIETNKRVLYIAEQSPGYYILYDNEAQQLLYQYNESGYYIIDDDRYSDINFRFFYDDTRQIIMAVNIDGGEMLFQYVGGVPYVLGQNSNLYPLNYTVPSIGFKNNQGFATNRGYIWSKSLPILKSSFWIGTGPDTFALVFPQYDVIGKRNMYKTSGFIVDKAHNLYLQIGIQQGGLALLVFLGIMVLYFIRFFKTLQSLKLRDVSLYHMNIGLTTGIFGFLIAGLGNDSTIGVNVVFWVLLGLGIGLQGIGTKTDDTNEVANESR